METETGGRFHLRDRLLRPVDPTPLVVFRIGFGALMLFSAARFLAKGWVDSQYIQPEFHFTYPLLDWIQPLPGDWLYLVFALQIVCAALIAVGWRYRLAALGFVLSFTYVELLDQATYLNHYYFVSLVGLLLVVLPLHHWWSADSAFAGGKAPQAAPRWISLVLQLQIAIVYFFAGVAKLNPDWLLEARPLGIWLAARSGFPVLGPLFEQAWFAVAMSWGGAAFDLTVPFLLFFRRTRRWAYVGVVGFHLLTGALFPIGVFPWVMIVCTLVFFDGEDYARIKQLVARWHTRTRLPGSMRATVPTIRVGSYPARSAGWATGGFLVAFLFVQLLLPLRHLAYPGSVLWDEEGFRFSWRVMLVEKTGTLFYAVSDPSTGRSWEAFPGDYLTPQQEKQLTFQPDMILTFAHHLQDRLAAEGIADPEIRALAYVSLNGRPSELLIDPEVDLTEVRRGFGPKPWVLPHPDL